MLKLHLKTPVLASILLSGLAASFAANAEPHDDRVQSSAPHMHFDSRFSHNQSYHDRGYAVRGMPRGAYTIHRGRDDFFYHGGEWYRRNGAFSVVIGAPIGAFVPVLPPFYSTVWWGSVPYYYADDTYYTWNTGANEYEVISPPDGIESDGVPGTPAESIFVYPKKGQSTEQQAQDRYECHRAAVLASGYDPTAAGGDLQAGTAANGRANYMRAEAACLIAREYSVK